MAINRLARLASNNTANSTMPFVRRLSCLASAAFCLGAANAHAAANVAPQALMRSSATLWLLVGGLLILAVASYALIRRRATQQAESVERKHVSAKPSASSSTATVKIGDVALRTAAAKPKTKAPDLTCSRLPREHQQAVLQFHARVGHVAEDLQAVFVAALLDGDSNRAKQQLATLAPILGAPVANRVPPLLKELLALDPIARLPTLELLRPQVAALPDDARVNLVRVARAYLGKIEPLDTFRFASVRLLLRVLVHAPPAPAAAPNAAPPTLEGYAAEAALICSLMAQATKGRKEQAYFAGLETLLSPRFQSDFITTAINGKDVDAAMQKLATLPHAQRGMISAALVRITGGNGDLSAPEMDLLRALCAGIVTPIPGTGAVRIDPSDLLAPRRAAAQR